jgi:predicted ATPase
VFVGSFALEAAQRVAADESIDEWAVLDAMGSLVDKSLVVAESQAVGEPRYRFLETMRQYGLDRLERSSDGDSARNRHLDVYVGLAEQAKSGLLGPQQGRLLRQLAARLRGDLSLCQARVAVGSTRPGLRAGGQRPHAGGNGRRRLRAIARAWPRVVARRRSRTDEAVPERARLSYSLPSERGILARSFDTV